MSAPQDLRLRRRQRLRFQLRKKAVGRPRLSVFRSGKHIYAQVIDDERGHTLVAAGSTDPELRALKMASEGMTKTERAQWVGRMVAQKAQAAGITKVVFDRGGFLYHGRVQALADAARESGLDF